MDTTVGFCVSFIETALETALYLKSTVKGKTFYSIANYRFHIFSTFMLPDSIATIQPGLDVFIKLDQKGSSVLVDVYALMMKLFGHDSFDGTGVLKDASAFWNGASLKGEYADALEDYCCDFGDALSASTKEYREFFIKRLKEAMKDYPVYDPNMPVFIKEKIDEIFELLKEYDLM